MSLQDWHKFGWLKPHNTSFLELSNLLAIADRDIADAESEALSADWLSARYPNLGLPVQDPPE